MGIQVVKNSTKQPADKKSKKAVLGKTQLIDGKLIVTKAAPQKPKPAAVKSVKRTQPAKKAAPRSTPAPQPRTSSGGSKGPVIAAVVVTIFVLLAVILIKAGSGMSSQARRTTSQSQRSTAPKPYNPKRYDSLGGMTMAEWEKKNNTNNKELNARKARRRSGANR